MRVLAWFDDPLCVIDHEMRDQYRALVTQLREQGVQVDEGAPKGMSLAQFYEPYLNLLGSVIGSSHKTLERQLMNWASPLVHKLGSRFKFPPLVENYLKGVGQSHVDWLRTNEVRLRLLEKVRPVFDQYDVILAPITPTTAIEHLHKPEMPLRKIRVNGEMRSYMEHLMWISMATLLGLPATSAPVNRSRNGLPINVQIIGGPYQDKLTIKFASLMSQLTGGFVVPPGY
jgi:amidase